MQPEQALSLAQAQVDSYPWVQPAAARPAQLLALPGLRRRRPPPAALHPPPPHRVSAVPRRVRLAQRALGAPRQRQPAQVSCLRGPTRPAVRRTRRCTAPLLAAAAKSLVPKHRGCLHKACSWAWASPGAGAAIALGSYADDDSSQNAKTLDVELTCAPTLLRMSRRRSPHRAGARAATHKPVGQQRLAPYDLGWPWWGDPDRRARRSHNRGRWRAEA